MSVHIGFFRDFKSSDTLLIDADSQGLGQLAAILRRLAQDRGAIAIHELPFVKVHRGIRIFAAAADRDSRISMNGVDFSWQRSTDAWQETADKLNALASATAAHQYLDADKNHLTVMASCGEYGDAWWAQNG